MLLTFGEVKTSRIPEIAQSCSSSDDFRSLVNEATEMLLERGDWEGTKEPIYVCTQRGCVTWPRYVGSVRELSVCGHPIPIHNVWYQFVDTEFYNHCCGQGTIRLNCNQHGHISGMVATGYYSTYNDVPGDSYIRAYATVNEDFGKTITIFGNDSNGIRLQTDNGDGTYSDGVVITLGNPYGTTSVLVQKGSIRVVKEATQGDVRLYAYDPVTATMLDLALYAPSETNPSYARYQLSAGCNCGTSSGVLALVKLAFIPVVNDNDLVLIGNMRALKYAIQSIKADEAGDVEKARARLVQAVNELNVQSRNHNPDSQISINLKPFGTAFPARHSIGRII